MHLVMGHVCFGKMTPFQKDDLPLIEYEHLGPLHTNNGALSLKLASNMLLSELQISDLMCLATLSLPPYDHMQIL